MNTSKYKYPYKTIWLWSGFRYEDILERENNYNIFNYIDVLVDGQFKKEYHNPTLRWKGSSNQRVIDVQSSLKEERVVEL